MTSLIDATTITTHEANNPAPRRRSKTPRRLIVTGVLLALLGGGAVYGDRAAKGYAEEKVGTTIASVADLPGAPPMVSFAGGSFLVQAGSGTYDEVKIRLSAENLDEPGTVADLVLRGVHLSATDAISGSVSDVPVDSIDGYARITYAYLDTYLGDGATVVPEGTGVRVTRNVEIEGRTVPVTGFGEIVLEGQSFVVNTSGLTAVDGSVPDEIVADYAANLDFSYPVPEFPFGLALTSVNTEDDGIAVELGATDTVLG